MKKIFKLFLSFAFILLLTTGCDEWDDLVDSVSGSGDDDTNVTITDDIVAEADTTADDTTNSDDSDDDTVEEATTYESRFHHTATGSSDGGKSLVLCPGQVMNFDRCYSDDVDLPYHGTDEGRIIYWNLSREPSGDIHCIKGSESYKYKANATMVFGDC